MRFGSPSFLWLLLLVPALVAFLWWAWRIKERLMTQFIQARLLPGLLADVSKPRQKFRLALLVASVALLAFVLARPQWGFGWEEVKQRGLDIVVAIDTSRSMLANDVAPNRLARAKLEALALRQMCRMDRLGLVAFAGTAFLQCPLSLDDEAIRQSLDALDVNIIPQGGTALADAIRTALTAFKEKSDNHKILVLFTDGEDLEGEAVDAAKEAVKDGLRIFTVGVGTPAGEMISVIDEHGQRTFIKDEQGQVIKSRLNEPLLQEIASVGNGFYLPLSGARTMDTLFERGLKPLPKGEFEGKAKPVYYERFQWFLGAAIFLLLLEMSWPEIGRSPKAKLASPKPAAALLGLLALSLTLPASGASASKALKQYQQGRYEASLNEYEKLAKKNPDDPRLHFNAGAAAFQGKDYDEALKQFGSSLATPDVKLQESTYYNLGNTRFRLGEGESDPEKRKGHWQQAVSSYESALKLDDKDPDARHNLDWVKQKLEELKQQQQQQKNQDKKDDQDKEDKQDKDQQKKDDQKKNDQNDQQKKDEQNKQDKQKKDEQKKKDEEKKSQQDQQKKDQQKQDQQQPQPQESKEGEKKDEPQDANAGKPMQMTVQQAKQLLDTLRMEERPMIFAPPATNRTGRHFKNW